MEIKCTDRNRNMRNCVGCIGKTGYHYCQFLFSYNGSYYYLLFKTLYFHKWNCE